MIFITLDHVWILGGSLSLVGELSGSRVAGRAMRLSVFGGGLYLALPTLEVDPQACDRWSTP